MEEGKFAETQWGRLRDLLDKARDEPELSEQLKTSPPSVVRDILRERFGLSADDVADLITEFENIADRNSLKWWSPIH
jgi:hypothetical protein